MFIVEGEKSVLEALHSDLEIVFVVATERFVESHASALRGEIIHVSQHELEKVGTFKTNDAALAVARMPQNQFTGFDSHNYTLVLDQVNDPGNLGTIIRLADWYGIDTVVVSTDTADCYSPKTISATKGSFCRIKVVYTDIVNALKQSDLPVFGAVMNGDNIHQVDFPEGGIIVMGNEANGISDEVAALLTHHITIPRFGQAESLNVAMATGIICDNIRRSQ